MSSMKSTRGIGAPRGTLVLPLSGKKKGEICFFFFEEEEEEEFLEFEKLQWQESTRRNNVD